ncbi:AAA domain-containing protein [Algoriphagus limi]|uniref:AAA domain-containing protein n=1 Tax=Algoriphagus limi TaxID=2975273 RepID=A0ABT2G3J2_9BACT|nr:AAA domain-containing protein [Algoriphagus limi]MCS5489841.1 AAA domain-containing protein [Algoriphagus limi]
MPESIFQTYLHRLTDLSTKNRSLYLPKLEGAGMIDLMSLDFLNGESSFEIIRKLIQGKKEISILPEFDSRLGEVNQLSKSLARMAFRDQLTQEETGEQSLYLTWLFAEGKLINGQVVRAPLLLKSIQLKKEKGEWRLQVQGNWQWNPAFFLAWRHATKQDLSENLTDDLLENLSKDPLEFRTALARIIPENIAIQVQSNLLEDRLIPFPNSQLALDQHQFSEGKISLKSYAVLGQFAQKGSFLFSDYEKLLKQYPSASLEDLFQDFYSTKSQESEIREENLFPVFPLDASQELALTKVRQGKSLVVQGPPGTGKSQLIANLVSDFIARGKKVLVVSQKRAALDVVYERLEKMGFGPFLALVHDFKADQKGLFEKIRNQIESIEDYQNQNRGIDAIQLERELFQLSKTISRLAEKFEDLRKALFSDVEAGIPVKALYLEASVQDPHFSHPSLTQMNAEQAGKFEQDFKIFEQYQEKFKKSFWEKRISFSKVDISDFSLISNILLELEKFRSTIPESFQGKPILELIAVKWVEIDFNDKVQELSKAFQNLPDKENSFKLIFNSEQKEHLRLIQSVLLKAKEASDSWKYSLPENLEALQKELFQALPQSQSFWGKLKIHFSKNDFPLLSQILNQEGMKFQTGVLEEIQQECQSRIEIQKLILDLPESTFFKPSGDFSKDLQQIDKLLNWNHSWNALEAIQNWANWSSMDFSEFSENFNSFQNLDQNIHSQIFSWKNWLSLEHVQEIISKGLKSAFPENPLNWPKVFSELKAFDHFLENWQFKELGFQLSNDFSESSFENKLQVFWNSWRLAWIGFLEAKYPDLAQLGSLTLVQEMQELKDSLIKKRQNSQHLALLKVREQVCEHLEYNRLGNRITYRELHHQVSKKRQRWPIRKLIEELGEEVFRVMPCWLGSPETISAVFPDEQVVDLVIFDEASQCPVERGLPAMLRGKQVVIAGDSKQLRPSDFYQIKWEGDEEGLEYEAESLLELASHFFENLNLRGHYRSADPGLIYFSNSHFYGNRLETLPDYETIKAGKTPFTWKKVEGIWENQVNRMEADAVLERVKKIKSQKPNDSIGIVTGNYFQMELIRETLWDAGIQGEGIKIRNIENVQGDEFDQVILSLGYAPNREGKLVTNFGLLGKSGAENRLNVAITRSRKMLHVISSIEPEDFRPNQLKNPGLSLLREFLHWIKTQSTDPDIPIPEILAKGFEIDWSLKSRLEKEDSHYSRKIPSAVMDLIWTDEQGNQKAVLTDDQRFFDAPTAKAAMAYHPILLEQKGWKWDWIWSRRF